ncbi:MAG: hypothetical protein ACC663_11060, partial [Gammaproteobacteria bacterium]
RLSNMEEPLIKSGRIILGCKMIKIKARNAGPLIDFLSPRHWHFPVRRNSRAIAKFAKLPLLLTPLTYIHVGDAEIDYFAPKMIDHDLISGSFRSGQAR